MHHVSVTNPLPKLRLCTTSSPCGRCLQPHAHSLLSSLPAAEPVGAFWECFQILESNPLLSESDRSEWYLRFANSREFPRTVFDLRNITRLTGSVRRCLFKLILEERNMRNITRLTGSVRRCLFKLILEERSMQAQRR